MELLDPSRLGDVGKSILKGVSDLVVGQSEAVGAVAQACQNFRLGTAPIDRPVSTFLLLGPTGVGKTYVVEALSKVLYNTEKGVIKINCGEFALDHEIAKLIGSPPGYLGHRETHGIFEAGNIKRWHNDDWKLSLILFDEIEKASSTLWDLLLGILDKGKVTLGDNTTTDFSNSLIFMTSNLGADSIASLFGNKLGFQHDIPTGDEATGKIKKISSEAVRRRFRPEFVNRIDHIISFNPLTEDETLEIFKREILKIANRFHSVYKATIVYTPDFRKFILRKGTDQRYGARKLKRVLETYVTTPLSNLIASGQLGELEDVHLDVKDDVVTYGKEGKNDNFTAANP